MSSSGRVLWIAVALACLFPHHAAAQSREDNDSLVVLISSKSAQVVDVEGSAYRKVIGPARFFHNNTYLLCDTAFWNVDAKYIDAIGNVQILQEETVLTGDKLTYLIDESLAQFRGSLVQLTDKDNNTLRTRDLDYNTKDSVAHFMNGGAMRDKDGQIIESRDGSYDSKKKLFTFRNDVNMFSDTVFVKTNELDYNSETAFAKFGTSTDLWNKENMLSADAGWYDRNREIFLFNRNVHLMSKDEEAWCDSVYYYRALNDVTMLGHVQIIDTTRDMSAVAGIAEYKDSLSRISMRRDPALIAKTTNDQGQADTVYVAADFIDYYTMMKFRIDSLTLAQSGERLKNLEADAVGTFRKKAAEEAAKAADQAAMENDANYAAKKAAEEIRAKRGAKNGTAGGDASAAGAPSDDVSEDATPQSGELAGKPSEGLESLAAPGRLETPSLPLTSDSLSVASDSLSVSSDSLAADDSLMVKSGSLSPVADSLEPKSDSLALKTDSLSFGTDSLALAADSLSVADSVAAVKLDSTKVGFMTALKNVRLFRNEAQIVCDSLLYSDLDSLARLYVEPIVWQETVRQYAADSIYVVVRNGAMDRASLMSDAFITIEEDTTHYDQVKAAEMMAFFENGGGLRRFDALGGAQALFFIKENDALATVNKTDSKMLSASFSDGTIQRIYYYDSAKSDAFPVVQLKEEERTLKGFNWKPERRPANRRAVTDAEYRSPERAAYLAHPRASFVNTNRYFPGYMKGIYREIAVRDSLQKVRAAEDALMRERLRAETALADSLALRDSLSLRDSLMVRDSLVLRDSLALRDSIAARDSLALRDSLSKLDSLSASDSLRLAGTDSLAVSDSLSAGSPAEPVAADPKALKAARKKAEKEARRAARAEARARRDAERDAKWQEKERRRKEKEAAKERKKLERLRAKKRRALDAEIREIQRETAVFEEYRKKYEKKKGTSADTAGDTVNRGDGMSDGKDGRTPGDMGNRLKIEGNLRDDKE